MKVYELHRKGETRHDEASGFVVRADSARRARKLASEGAGDEGALTWLDPQRSTCRPILATGRERILLVEFLAG